MGQFPAVRDFLYKVIDELNVSPEGTRVAVAQYSDDVRVESRFDQHMNKPEILNLVKRMKIKTGKALNLGYALDYAQRYVFVSSAGSRIEEGVPQFLVLLVAGKSSDRVDGPASNLKQGPVVPFVLQAKNADPAQLELIVLSPAFILAAESLPKIGDLQPQIVNLLKVVQNGAPTPGRPRKPQWLPQPGPPGREVTAGCWLRRRGETVLGFAGTMEHRQVACVSHLDANCCPGHAGAWGRLSVRPGEQLVVRRVLRTVVATPLRQRGLAACAGRAARRGDIAAATVTVPAGICLSVGVTCPARHSPRTGRGERQTRLHGHRKHRTEASTAPLRAHGLVIAHFPLISVTYGDSTESGPPRGRTLLAWGWTPGTRVGLFPVGPPRRAENRLQPPIPAALHAFS